MKKYSLTSDVIDELVQRINRGKTVNVEPSVQSFNSDKSHLLVIFTGTDYGLNESLAELINAKKHYGFSYDVGFSFSGAHVIGEKGIDHIIKSLEPVEVYYEEDQLILEKVLSNAEGIIVPMSTQDTVSKLAFGIQDSFVSTLLWQAIWRGKTVLMDFENSVKFKGIESKSEAQQRIVENHLSNVVGLGVVEIQKQHYIVGMLNEFKNANIKSEIASNSKSTVREEIEFPKILTSKDLLELVGDNKSLKVPDTTIVTPLAIDTAKEKGIVIIKE